MHFAFKWRRAALAATAVVASIMAFQACSDTIADTPPAAKSHGPTAAVNQFHAAAVRASRERSSWVGEAHHAAMKVAIAEAKQRKARGRGRLTYGGKEYCALVRRIGLAALDVIDKHQESRLSTDQRESLIRQDPALASCGGSVAESDRSTPRVLTSVLWAQSEAGEVTGAYEPYVDLLESAAMQSDGSVPAIRSNLDAVLVQAAAAGIPSPDLNALGGFAGMIESSAAEWSNFDWQSVAPAGCTNAEECAAVTSYRPQNRSKFWKVLGADVGGCLSSVRSWGALRALLFAPAWQALAGYCGVRAAIASGIALFVT